MQVKTYEIIVLGKVQGVGFRSCVRRIAGRLSITGEVMNLPDGTVRILASSDQIILEKFISMLYSCSRAVIRDIRIGEHAFVRYSGFEISHPDTLGEQS
jgi:acylphosphatase